MTKGKYQVLTKWYECAANRGMFCDNTEHDCSDCENSPENKEVNKK